MQKVLWFCLLQFRQLMESESKNSSIRVLCLGAGQDVGRSCVLVTLADKTIVFDVGIHMLYSDSKRYPDFSQVYSPPQTINDVIDLVIITHFHLDHCGALPFLTEHHKYNGPIITSTPTKALIPIMLQDYSKVLSDTKKQEQFYFFGSAEARSASSKIKSIGLFQSIVINGIKVTSYYAGHVLGACMFHVQYAGLSAVYTGDYNSNADRHLGAASAPRLRPNILLTQTTYATTIRDTKRDRERAMLQIITSTVEKGGKVLIPVFALGRAQELSVLLETYWKRTDSNVPVYFSAGLTEKANLYYRLFADWQNQKIQQQFAEGDNVFEFKKVKPFDKNLIRAQTPYVLLATPGMLHSGTSMQVFKQWCADERNTIIIPGYCVQGTLGNKLLKGEKEVIIDKKTYQVKMRVQNVSFSAHADAKGIINLLRNIDPDQIIFVHGDKTKMEAFKPMVQNQLRKNVYMPANHDPLHITAKRREIIDLKQTPTLQQGYLRYEPLDNNNAVEYCLIQEQQLLREVNQILQMNRDESIVVKKDIESEFFIESYRIPEHLKQKYQRKLVFENIAIKKQQKKQAYEEMVQENQDINCKITGNLTDLSKFLGELNEVKVKTKF